jgi:hypothetical protein
VSKTPGQKRGRSSADKWRSGRGWGKILTLAPSPGTFVRPSLSSTNRHQVPWGANRGPRSLSGSPDPSSDRALCIGQVVSQVPALWRGAVCHASAAAMAVTIRAATRSACHQPSVSHITRAVSASRLDVALRLSAHHGCGHRPRPTRAESSRAAFPRRRGPAPRRSSNSTSGRPRRTRTTGRSRRGAQPAPWAPGRRSC